MCKSSQVPSDYGKSPICATLMPYTWILDINCFQGPSRVHFSSAPTSMTLAPHSQRSPRLPGLWVWDPAWTQPFPSLGWGGPQARGHHLWLLPVLWSQQGPLLLLRHIPRSPREREGCTLPGGFAAAKGVDLPHSSDWKGEEEGKCTRLEGQISLLSLDPNRNKPSGWIVEFYSSTHMYWHYNQAIFQAYAFR